MEEVGSRESGLVGRETELGLLSAHLDLSRTSTNGPLLLAGDPGIGKSRLLSEIADLATDDGWRVVWGRSWNDLESPPYWTWTQIARELRGLDRGTDLATVVLDEPDHTERFELFDATADLVRQASRDEPLLVLLDDLHAADLPSLLLTRFISQQAADQPLAIIGSYRVPDLTQRVDLHAHIEALAQAGTEIRLGPLTPESVATMVGDPAMAAEIHSLTGGNPLFVEQVLRLAPSDRARSEPAEIATADMIRVAIATRISMLDEGPRRALVAASVLGHAVDQTEIAALLGESATTIQPDLDELVAAGLLRRTSSTVDPASFDTVHALIAETASSSGDLADLERVHARAAALIGDDPERLGERAHHLLRAGVDRALDAVEACIAAAEAVAAVAGEEAVDHYQRALQALESAPAVALDPVDRDRHRLTILLELGKAQRRADRVEAADSTFEAAERLAESLDDPEGLAMAALRGGIQYYFRRDVEESGSDRLENALDALPEVDDPLRARLLADLSVRVTSPRDPEGSRELADAAVTMARRLDEPAALGYALIAQQAVDIGPRTLPRRASTAREVLVLARRTADPTLAVQGRFLLLAALLEQGDIRGLDAGLTESPHEAGHLADRNHARFRLWLDCTRALFDGDAERAEDLAGRCLALGIEHGEPYAPRVYGGQLGAIRWLQNRSYELEPIYDDQRKANPDEPVWPAALAYLHADRAHLDQTRTALAQVGDPAAVPHGLHWLVTMTLAGEAAAAYGDEATVAAYWEQLLPYADRFVPINLGAAAWGTVARRLGMLALALGHDDEGLAHLERAVSVCRRLGARSWLVEAELELADALIRTGHADDPRIPKLVGDARAGAVEMGLARFVEKADSIDLRPQTASTPTGPTNSERQASIAVLGTFEVASASGQVARWSSKKARELLKILVARRGTPIHREVLMDHLWPGVDPSALGNRLSVALSTVRRTLDPDRTLPNDTYIATDRTAVWLRLDHLDIDAEEFLALAHHALVAHTESSPEAWDRLVAASAAHRGPALPDEPYAEWASPLQSEVRFARMRVLKALADRALESGDHLTAADTFQRLAEAEPFDEMIHEGLVAALERIGASTLADGERRRFRETNLAS